MSILFHAVSNTNTNHTNVTNMTKSIFTYKHIKYTHTLIQLRCENTLTASMMTEHGVLAVNAKPRLLAPLTNAPSSKHNMNISSINHTKQQELQTKSSIIINPDVLPGLIMSSWCKGLGICWGLGLDRYISLHIQFD